MKSSELAVAARAALAPLQALQRLATGLADIEQLQLTVEQLESRRKVNEDAIETSSKLLTDLIAKVDQQHVVLAKVQDDITAAQSEFSNITQANLKAVKAQDKALLDGEAKTRAEIEKRLEETRKGAFEVKDLLDEEIKVLTATRDSLTAEIEALKAKFA